MGKKKGQKKGPGPSKKPEEKPPPPVPEPVPKAPEAATRTDAEKRALETQAKGAGDEMPQEPVAGPSRQPSKKPAAKTPEEKPPPPVPEPAARGADAKKRASEAKAKGSGVEMLQEPVAGPSRQPPKKSKELAAPPKLPSEPPPQPVTEQFPALGSPETKVLEPSTRPKVRTPQRELPTSKGPSRPPSQTPAEAPPTAVPRTPGKSSPEKQPPPKAQLGAAATPSQPQAGPSALDMTSVKASLPVASSLAGRKPIPRPDVGGTKGRKIALRANFFRMSIRSDVTVQHYDVALNPEIKSKAKVREVFNAFVSNNKTVLFKDVHPVFDGMKNMYTHCKLRFSGKFEGDVRLGGDGPATKPIKVTIQHAATIPLAALAEFLNGRLRDCPQDAVQALDIALREFPNQRYTPVTRYFFTHPTGHTFEPALELWTGYYQTVRPGWKVALLNVDSSVRLFHKGQHIIELLCEIIGAQARGFNDRTLTPREHADFEAHIKGLAVEIDVDTYTNLTRRTYKIVGLSKQPCRSQTFPMSQPDGSERPCIVADYFRQQYNINLRYPSLPCLQAQPKEKHRYIPMELCIVKKGQQLRSVSDKLKSELIRYSAVPAPTREAEINKIVAGAFRENEFSKAFGLNISPQMVELNGRVLQAPAIQYKARDAQVRQGSWNMVNLQFYSGAVAEGMAVVCFDDRTRDDTIWAFVEGLYKAAKEVGMTLPDPYSIDRIDRGRYVTDVGKIMKEIHSRSKTALLLILVILPAAKSNDIYGEIKRVGDLVLGVVTQCVQAKNVYSAKPQTLANICQKINAKLGEVNAIIQPTVFSKIFSKPVIIFGADVTHPSPGDPSNPPSIAAVTASYDRFAFKYEARISMQKRREEMILDLKAITKDLLTNFGKRTGKEPLKIIFYRDGVSEGQFSDVLSRELQAIQLACYELSPNYKPQITYIVVQKRHHARLFCKDPRDRVGKSQNVPAGTTVDTDIVHPVEFDFYLCSQQGIQGTSKPAHYHVLYDDSNFTSDEIQELTYQLCHVYARCTRSVSIPAPVYYAHHCAFRGRYYYDRLKEERRVPEAGPDEALIRELNNSCSINENYRGMFFA